MKLKEDAAERSAMYIEAMNRTIAGLKTKTPPKQSSVATVNTVLTLASNYTDDAKHYLAKSQPVTSLACIAYAEGLLDALKFLDLIEVTSGSGLQSPEMDRERSG